jgi:hypothetical protein
MEFTGSRPEEKKEQEEKEKKKTIILGPGAVTLHLNPNDTGDGDEGCGDHGLRPPRAKM